MNDIVYEIRTAYDALKRAHASGDWESVLAWANLLADIQHETGSDLEFPEFLELVTQIAQREAVKRRMAEMEAHEGFDGWTAPRYAIEADAIDLVRRGYNVDAAIDYACDMYDADYRLKPGWMTVYPKA